MLLIHILVVAFAVLADAQWNYTGGYRYQQKAAAQVVGSNTGSNLGSNTGSGLGASLGSANKEAAQVVGSNTGGSTASFTQYGPCNSPSLTSCAWYSSSGYNAAISQAAYHGSAGSGPSDACGVCWKLTPQDFPGANEIVVKVNNLCPNDGHNPLCSQPENVDINFDLCEDSGAAAALFGSSGTQQVNGTAAVVDCSEWSGGPNVS